VDSPQAEIPKAVSQLQHALLVSALEIAARWEVSMDLLEAILSMAAQQRKALAEASQNRCWQRVKAGLDREGDSGARETSINEDTDDPVLDRWPNLHRSRN